jgi:hypothetical protein
VADSAFCEFDASFSILNNDVASNVGLALFSHANDSVMPATLDLVAPKDGRRPGRLVIADNFDSILVRFLNQVVDDARLVVENFDTAIVKHEFIRVDLNTGIRTRTFFFLTFASTSKLEKIAVQWLKASLLPRMVGRVARP